MFRQMGRRRFFSPPTPTRGAGVDDGTSRRPKASPPRAVGDGRRSALVSVGRASRVFPRRRPRVRGVGSGREAARGRDGGRRDAAPPRCGERRGVGERARPGAGRERPGVVVVPAREGRGRAVRGSRRKRRRDERRASLDRRVRERRRRECAFFAAVVPRRRMDRLRARGPAAAARRPSSPETLHRAHDGVHHAALPPPRAPAHEEHLAVHGDGG